MKAFKIFLFLLINCFFSAWVFADTVDISLDKNVISEGDTVNLTISYSGENDDNPDLTDLQKDFQIVSNFTSKQVNYINGVFSQIKKWTIGLKPLKLGKITIKPIKIGNISSNYADVEVKEITDVAYVPDREENSNSPYFQIEQTLSPSSPYINQQTIIWVTIYDSLGLHNASLLPTEETMNNWSLSQLTKEPFVSTDIVQGKKVNVVKYAFAAFPLKSGEIASPQFVFDGAYIKNVGFSFPNFNDSFLTFGVDFQNAFAPKVPVRMKTKIEKINVKPIPSSSTNVWLPLSDLVISSQWAPNTKFQVGEALTRQITVRAFGLQEENFPDLTFPDIKGFKQYPEKPVLSSAIEKNQIVTTAKYNIIYIPSQSGDFLYPRQEITWFDVNSEEFKNTVIPSENITISSNPNFSEKISETFSPSNQIEQKSQNENSSKIDENNKPSSTLKNDIPYFLIVISLFIVILFVFLINSFSKKFKAQNHRSDVIASIKRGKYSEARNNLILWAQKKMKDTTIQNLNDVAAAFENTEFKEQLNRLNQILYSPEALSFDKSKFIAIFKKIDAKKIKLIKKKDILPNLYN